MSKVALVLACNTHWAPYMHRYIEELNILGKEIVLIYWDREKLLENLPFETIAFEVEDVIAKRGWKKPLYFIEFAFFVKKILKKVKFEKVIFLGTYACVPALLADFLKHKYRGRYWVDIRDLTYEENRFFNFLQRKVIANSYKTVISSKGFEEFLPHNEYGYIHNIDPDIETMAKQLHKTESDVIRVSYIGNVGFYSECKKFLDVFANDDRFRLGFYGAGSDELKDYCLKNKINNVAFSGRFERSKTVNFYSDTDIIYNNYGNSDINLQTALSNKLYYAIRFDYPIIVSENTYMETISKENGFGFTVKYTDKLPDELFKWYHEFKEKAESRSNLWQAIKHEDDEAISELRCFLCD